MKKINAPSVVSPPTLLNIGKNMESDYAILIVDDNEMNIYILKRMLE